MPSLYYQLGTVDDSDPANVYVNNPGLRRASTHSASLEFTRFWQATHRNLSVNAHFSHTNRAVAQARHYDRQTGVSTWVPENIDGNWNTDAAVQFTLPFGRDEAFQFQTAAGGGTGGQHDGLVAAALQFGQADVRALAHTGIAAETHADLFKTADLGGYHVIGQTVGGDAVTQHAAGERTGFEDRDRIAHEGQEPGAGKTGRTEPTTATLLM